MVFASVEVRLAFPAMVTDRVPDVRYDLSRWLKAPPPSSEKDHWLAAAFAAASGPALSGRSRRR